MKMDSNKGFMNLRDHIIYEMVCDYQSALISLHNDPEDKESEAVKAEIEEFLESDMYGILMPTVPADRLRKIIIDELESVDYNGKELHTNQTYAVM